MVVRGVPRSLARDAWWLDDADPPEGLRPLPLLLVALLAADWLAFGFWPGLGLALWFLLAGGVIALGRFRRISMRQGLLALAVLLATVLPLIEVVQFGTLVVALAGLGAFALVLSLPALSGAGFARALLRLPFAGIVQSVRDLFALRLPIPSQGRAKGILSDWALPLGIGAIFLLLFAAANPVIDQFLYALGRFEGVTLPDGWRIAFWVFFAALIWPLLRITAMDRVLARAPRARQLRSGLVNDRSVLRALIIFNGLFLAQSVLDAGYLWGGVSLPEGMTYATYAHRGAYPLLVTALLAGLFALVAQPYLGAKPWVRWLLYLWIAQNVLLVVSSILRLDLYVEAYGLTRLRVAAFVWMVVVALGLLLIVMQMWGERSRGWFLARAFGLGFLAIYACNLWNIDGLIARHNISNGQGGSYLCGLGEGAVPVILRAEKAGTFMVCQNTFDRPTLYARHDWREWGYRNWRLHRSVAAMEAVQ